MRFKQLKARLIAEHHIKIYAPWQDLPDWGWHVVVWPSEFHPQGWAIRITHPHRILNPVVAKAFESVGYWVQWSDNDPRMEAWPKE